MQTCSIADEKMVCLSSTGPELASPPVVTTTATAPVVTTTATAPVVTTAATTTPMVTSIAPLASAPSPLANMTLRRNERLTDLAEHLVH